MRTSHWIIIFLTVFLLLLSPIIINHEIIETQQTQQIELDSELLTACIAGISTVSNQGEKPIFETEYNRKLALKAFQDSLKSSLSMSDTKAYDELIKSIVPCIAMIDYDGFYIVYSKDYDVTRNNTMETDLSQITTQKHSWMGTYGNYTVTYQLNNSITINALNEKRQYKGTREQLNKFIPYTGALQFLANETDFKEEKNRVIVNSINKAISYFINTHNTNTYNTFNIQYVFSISQSEDNYKSKTIIRPCMIAFAQGKQTLGFEDVINIYAITGSELIDPYVYYIANVNGEAYYHEEDCSINGVKTIQNKSNLFKGDMKSCAEKGAFPCPYCIQ